MNLTFKLALVFFLLLTLSCKEQHLFSDQSELATVTRDFEDKQKALPHGDLFRIFTTSLTTEEREALMFLYAYMPIGDITDYSGDYYLMNVRYALKTRQEMPWGCRIPERKPGRLAESILRGIERAGKKSFTLRCDTRSQPLVSRESDLYSF